MNKTTQTVEEMLEQINSRYTKHLAAAMGQTKLSILRQLVDASAISNYQPNHKSYEIEVDFNE